MPENKRDKMPTCIAIFGAGRMGSVFSQMIPKRIKKIIIDTNLESANQLALKVDGIASDNIESARNADLVVLLMPTSQINQVAKKLINVLNEEAIILNMATAATIAPSIRDNTKNISIVDAKIIGQAKAIASGDPGLIVIKCDDFDQFNFIHNQISGHFKVVQGNAELVESINNIAVIEGLKAAITIKRKLSELKVPEEWSEVAICTVCAGTIKSYINNDLGPHAKELVKELEDVSS